MTNFDLSWAGMLALLIQVILPIVVGLITKVNVSAKLKAIILLALTSVGQFLVMWQANFDHFDWRLYAFNVAVGFVISVGVHFGLYKPTGLADAAQNSLVK